jgi:hypothetical protein
MSARGARSTRVRREGEDADADRRLPVRAGDAGADGEEGEDDDAADRVPSGEGAGDAGEGAEERGGSIAPRRVRSVPPLSTSATLKPARPIHAAPASPRIEAATSGPTVAMAARRAA